jgi:taurine--2-oxoglutarate transaminase
MFRICFKKVEIKKQLSYNKGDNEMLTQEIKETAVKYTLQSWSKQKGLNPIPVKGGEGIYFWDFEGNRYSDMSSQLVNLNLGHGNRAIIDAIKEQAEKYCFVSPAYASEPRAKLAKMIVELMPDNMGKVFFTNGGADANENAVKMARMFTGRNKVFSRYRSYHGSTFGAGNLTGEPRRYPLEPGIPGFVKFFDPYLYREKIKFSSEREAAEYYVDKLREQVCYEGPQNVAAIVLETVTGSNGVIIPPEGYLQGVRKICDDYGIIMICDEVMAGFGRTGKMFAFEHFGVKPDMVTFAKGVTCGYIQLGGVVVSKEIAAYFDDNLLSCGLTYSGHPLACAAGVACINYYKENNVLENVEKSGKVLGKLLEELKAKHKCVGDVRYIGLFSAIELVRDKVTKEPLVPYGADTKGVMKSIVGRLAKQGFMTYSHENMVLVAPPLIITPEQLSEEMAKMDKVLSEVDDEI